MYFSLFKNLSYSLKCLYHLSVGHDNEFMLSYGKHTFTSYISAATTLTFDKSQFVLVTLPEESYTESEDISLRFRTIQTDGLLLMTRSSLSNDAIELFLERGACKLTISLGPRSKVRTVPL